MKSIAILMVLAATPVLAAPKKDKPSSEQKEADRHFKSGVALYKEAKYAEALAEFERAYEIAPHPLVLYNIATCHRELSHYGDAVKFYKRFLDEGKGKVPPPRLAEAQTELDAILKRVARITVKVTPDTGVTLLLDGNELGSLPLEMPLIVAPGQHKLVARAPGKREVDSFVRVASGDEVEVAMKLVDASGDTAVGTPPPSGGGVRETMDDTVAPSDAKPKRFMLGAGFGTNVLLLPDAGAPSLGVGFAVHPRVEIGLDAVLVAYAVMPNVRVRLAGEAMSVHAALAVPVAFTDGEMSETFVGGAAGLGVRYRATPALAFRLEGFVAYAGKDHGTTLPAFLGGELWF